MKKDEYKCAKCGGVFKKGWSDKETMKEMKELWGNIPLEERVIVCDDCFKEIHPEKNLEIARKCGYIK